MTSVHAGPDGVRLRLHGLETLVDAVEAEMLEPERVQVRWADSGVPQCKEYDAKALTDLPALPSLPEMDVEPRLLQTSCPSSPRTSGSSRS